MSGDAKERQRVEQERLQREIDELRRREDRPADNRRVEVEIERIRASRERSGSALERAKEDLERLDRIAERNPTLDPERVKQQEDREIDLNPEAYIRRHGSGFDPATERRLRQSLLRSKERERDR